MKIGILQTGHVPDEMINEFGEYNSVFERFLSGYDFEFEGYLVVDGEFPLDVKECDGWLITGSKHGAYEDHPWIAPLEDFIRATYASNIPMIGVCFGHQIIAQALGGKVEKFDGGWAVGRQHYDDGSALHAWHQDQVVEIPKGAEVLSGNSFCANAMLSYGNKMLTIQPHPEFDDSFVQGLLMHRAQGVVPEEKISGAKEQLGLTIDQRKIADQFAAFFKEPRA